MASASAGRDAAIPGSSSRTPKPGTSKPGTWSGHLERSVPQEAREVEVGTGVAQAGADHRVVGEAERVEEHVRSSARHGALTTRAGKVGAPGAGPDGAKRALARASATPPRVSGTPTTKPSRSVRRVRRLAVMGAGSLIRAHGGRGAASKSMTVPAQIKERTAKVAARAAVLLPVALMHNGRMTQRAFGMSGLRSWCNREPLAARHGEVVTMLAQIRTRTV